MWPNQESAITSSMAVMGFSSSTSTTTIASVKRIPTRGLDDQGVPLNVKGICANAQTKRLYVSTTRTLSALDLVTEKLLWEKTYEGGCDRMAISPDGQIIYLPSLEKDHWHVVNALTGEIIKKIVARSGAHNTIIGLDGAHAYLAGLRSPTLRVTDIKTRRVHPRSRAFWEHDPPFYRQRTGNSLLCERQ